MDYNNVKNIKMHCDQIRKFRNLDKYKNISIDEFSEDMQKLFPDFIKNNKMVFDSIVTNKDLDLLDLMFNKLEDIHREYNSRKNELDVIKSKVEDIRALLRVNENMNKDKLISFIENTSPEFVNKYPIIIDRLLDKETANLSVEDLLFDQIKYKYETHIGESLANKYVYPKINK
jgi:hypothetical protein